MTDRAPRDGGQVLLLVIGFAVILIALITVVVDTSRVFLQRRALASAADGAVTAAVQAVDETAIYANPGALDTGFVPLDEDAARQAVLRYVADRDLAARFVDFAVDSVDVDPAGIVVALSFSATVELPFVGLVSSRYAHGVRVTVLASGRAPLG